MGLTKAATTKDVKVAIENSRYQMETDISEARGVEVYGFMEPKPICSNPVSPRRKLIETNSLACFHFQIR